MANLNMSKVIDDLEYKKIVTDIVMKEEISGYDVESKQLLAEDVFNSLRKNGIIQELLDSDGEISEIMINGYDSIFYEKNGKIIQYEKKFESKEVLDDIIQRMVSAVNRTVNAANPIVDARLKDGSRINVVLPPVAVDGPTVTIRKFLQNNINLEGLVERGTITREVAVFLQKLVRAKYNIFISGGTGSGKTTFLNALTEYIPMDERIVTIEDSVELQIKSIPNIVRLEVRNSNYEGKNNIGIRELIKSALRMRPDRLIIGEIRDEAAIDLLDAYNTGHHGSISTGHANSAVDMLDRIESMVLMGSDIPIGVIRKKISSSIDIIIHLGRMRDKSRKVLEIAEILECRQNEILVNMLYEFKEDVNAKNNKTDCVKGRLYKVNELTNVSKLILAGDS